MKRFFSVILISAALLGASFTSNAQYFNHLSLGIGAGLDGASLQVGLPVGPLLQIRAGASYWPPIGIPYSIQNIHFYGSLKGDVDVKATMAYKSFNALLDFYPGKKTRFHLTGGVYYSPEFFGNGVWANVVGNATAKNADGSSTVLTDAGVMIGDTFVGTDSEGKLRGYLASNKLLPYFGIGSGRSVGTDSAVTFLFDLGVLYLGSNGFGAYAEGENMKTLQPEIIRVTSDDTKFGSDQPRDKGLIDLAASIPVMPVLKFSLFFRLF